MRVTEIESLISNRLQELRITRTQLVVRCGFSNLSKGLRRLEEISSGEFSRAHTILAKLPAALGLEPHVVEGAVVATLEAEQRAEEQWYRESFRPHAIILCERTRPEPIWLAAVLGVEKILRVDFAEASAPISYVRQALATIQGRVGSNGSLPAFGRPIGFTVNYSPDLAVSFRLDGTPRSVRQPSIRVSEVSLGGRKNIILAACTPMNRAELLRSE